MEEIVKLCPICMGEHAVTLTDEQFERYLAWKNGEGRVQDMLPDLTPGERETLKTGVCERCWGMMTGKECE